MDNFIYKKIITKFTLYTLSLTLFNVILLQNIFTQVNTNPNNTNINVDNYSQLNSNKNIINEKNSNDDKSIPTSKTRRVIANTSIELVEDDSCECAFVAFSSDGFPYYPIFAIGGAAFIPVAISQFDDKLPTGPTNVVSPSRP